MPALWQSSQRPMYVRTVWVGGFRHAILTHDDPFFTRNNSRRPHSSATCSSKTRKRNPRRDSDDLEDCLRKFNFVVNSKEVRQRPKTGRSRADVESLDLSDVDQSEDDFLIKASQQPIYEPETSRSKFDSVYLSMRTLKSNRTARNDVKENTELSERVLQWLDLAGKVDLLAPDNVERMSQPRHSWPGFQRRNQLVKSKTSIDMRKDAKIIPKMDSAKSQIRYEPIDRQDFYEPVSANTIENYARQSRNHSTPRQEPTMKYTNKTKAKDLRTNIMEARQKIALERTEMEKKYAKLVNKKLMPDLKGNKKQVHIFMPELPKKTSIPNSATESLLSHLSQLSQMSKK
ncbi:hypothetical protein NE865_11473 [Phthorimaea operculella]|nr:hypothetical protein NE865_11473 [Phthorimaea operculella]